MRFKGYELHEEDICQNRVFHINTRCVFHSSSRPVCLREQELFPRKSHVYMTSNKYSQHFSSSPVCIPLTFPPR